MFSVLFPACYSNGEISFASYYANSMVLQAEPSRAVIWGYGDEQNVGKDVVLTFVGKQYTSTIHRGKISISSWPG